MRRTILFLLLLLIGCESDHESSSVQVQTDIDTTIARIGDVLYLSVKANNINDRIVVFTDILETESMEIRKKTVLTKKSNPYQVNFEIVFWDTGSFAIPEYPIDILKLDSTKYLTILSDSIDVQVISMLSDASDKNLRPIKDPIAIKKPINWYRLTLAIILVILLLILIGLWRRRIQKKQLNKIDVSEFLSAKDIALSRISELAKLTTANNKSFYVQLSFLIREFLENQFYVRALEMTTNEIRGFKINYNLSKSNFETLINLLDRADLAKFAKYGFSTKDREADYQWINSFISTFKE